MNKRYLVWQDPSCNGIDPVWEELTGAEFYSMLQLPENKDRRFEILEALDWDDDLITIETTPKAYAAWKKEYNARRYRRMRDKDIEVISLNGLIENGPDLAADGESVEDVAITRALCMQVPEALEALSKDELAIIELRYIEGLSGRKTATQLNIPEGTYRYRRDLAISKLYQALSTHPHTHPDTHKKPKK